MMEGSFGRAENGSRAGRGRSGRLSGRQIFGKVPARRPDPTLRIEFAPAGPLPALRDSPSQAGLWATSPQVPPVNSQQSPLL